MRLDSYLVEKNLYKSRTKAVEGIDRGEILINEKVCYKPSYDVKNSDIVTQVQQKKPYVSIGGDKLERAITKIMPEVLGKTFIDVGASTGGFTDCLLRNGAKKVYCVDVGENLLDKSISEDDRVVVMDRTNARFLTTHQFESLVDGIVVDCSFISLEYVLPSLVPLLNNNGYMLALIKPQFELQERIKMKNGILRNDKIIAKIIRRLYDFALECGISVLNVVPVTIDKNKNQEFIMHLKVNSPVIPFEDIFEG